MGLQSVSADHGRDGQRYHGGNRNGECKRQRERLEETADNATHEEQGNEGGQQRQADGDNGETDLPRAFERRAHRLHARFQIGIDVFDHHNGIVDNEPDGYGQRHQGKIVDGQAPGPHGGEGAGQRQGHRDTCRNGRCRAPQENHDDRHHQANGCQKGPLHIVDAGMDGRGAVREDGNVDARRDQPFQIGQQCLYRINGGDDIGIGLLRDVEKHGGLAVIPGIRTAVSHALVDSGDIGKAHGSPVAAADNDAAVILRRFQLRIGADREGKIGAVDGADRLGHVGVGDRRAHIVE
eukprot:gene27037-biopygen23195